MHTLEGLPMLEYYNNLLAKGDKQSAWRIMHEFFRLFDEKEQQESLWYILTAALKSENEEIEARHRSDMIFFYEYSIVFFKAAHLLCHEQSHKKLIKKPG